MGSVGQALLLLMSLGEHWAQWRMIKHTQHQRAPNSELETEMGSCLNNSLQNPGQAYSTWGGKGADLAQSERGAICKGLILVQTQCLGLAGSGWQIGSRMSLKGNTTAVERSVMGCAHHLFPSPLPLPTTALSWKCHCSPVLMGRWEVSGGSGKPSFSSSRKITGLF